MTHVKLRAGRLKSVAPLHQAVIAPSMMYLLYQLDGDVPGYPRKQFEDDIVNECEKDIRSCFAAGAAHVVMDFTEGRLAPRNDPRPRCLRRPPTGLPLCQFRPQ